MAKRKRMGFPSTVVRLAKERNMSMRDALVVYNQRMRARARGGTVELTKYAQQLEVELAQFKLKQQ